MRLLVDARYVRAVPDGIGRYSASLLHALAELQGTPGYEDLRVAMVLHDDAGIDRLPDLPSVRAFSPTGPLEPLTGLALNRYRPDALFSPMQTVGGLGRRYGLVLTLHDLIYYEHPEPPSFLPAPVRAGWRLFHRAYWPQRLLLDRADAVATVSRSTAALMAAHRLTRRPVRLVPNAAPAAPVPEATALDRAGTREKILLYMGSAMPYKNVETLVRGMAGLPDYELQLLSRYDPRRRAELEALVPEGARVVFRDGVSEEEYQALLARCTALVTASAAEGYGLPVVEAMAAGTPVVLSDIPIFREIAASQCLTDFSAPGALARAVRGLEDPEEYRRRVLAGLAEVGRWSWEDSARALVAVVREAAADRRR